VSTGVCANAAGANATRAAHPVKSARRIEEPVPVASVTSPAGA
jgi:hypothetical protein